MSPIPPDLRKIKKPVHTRLSVASAGLPGDDMADVEAIREDWMRRKVEDDLFARSEKAKLRCRICFGRACIVRREEVLRSDFFLFGRPWPGAGFASGRST